MKDGGGILEQISPSKSRSDACRPTFRAAITVDASALNIGDSLHVSDLQVPGVSILSEPTTTIATVVPPTVVEETVAVDAAAVPTEGEPEVIAKGKKDEEDEEKES